ncbi:hypothetical protein BDY24DRAFT_436950 [Mrakia frigida]|uniref:uncharacterized protein n=1 Tax=Mrakia frigida TaxID=29902 RepID=UPI003FCC0AB1
MLLLDRPETSLFLIPSWTTAQAINFWPIQPKSLTETLPLLNITVWGSVQKALPSLRTLDKERDFTFFLPPNSALLTALSLPSDGLSDFINAHLVQNERILLTNNTKSYTTVGGGSLQGNKKWISVEGGRNATVLERDLLTTGGLIQLIDRSLYVFPNETSAVELGATRRREL